MKLFDKLFYQIKLIARNILWGFNPRDIWSLDVALSKWLIPRLKKLKETKKGVPIIKGFDPSTESGLEKMDKEWGDRVDKMVRAFEIIRDEESLNKTSAEVEEGLDLFREHFHDLWD